MSFIWGWVLETGRGLVGYEKRILGRWMEVGHCSYKSDLMFAGFPAAENSEMEKRTPRGIGFFHGCEKDQVCIVRNTVIELDYVSITVDTEVIMRLSYYWWRYSDSESLLPA